MRGDRPYAWGDIARELPFTPHARGSTIHRMGSQHSPSVYPACAGIDPISRSSEDGGKGLPRMRGDRPYSLSCYNPCRMFTPHARGSTCCSFVHVIFPCVYPACAGIDRGSGRAPRSLKGLPRMRGDRPLCYSCYKAYARFTPHARGSTVCYNGGVL